MTAPSDDLQFSTAEPAALSPEGEVSAALACRDCGAPITTSYFTVAGRTTCAACKAKVEHALAGGDTSRAARVSRALLYGFGAALVGAAIWFAVAVIFDLEIGLIAILCGWMVGRAVRKGSGERGGRRYQVVAALLTYLSVAMSYGALGIRELAKGDTHATPAATTSASRVDSAGATRSTTAAANAATVGTTADGAGTTHQSAAKDSTHDTAPGSGVDFAKSVLFMLGFMFVLPIVVNVSGSNILGVAIIAFGIFRAWRMNEPTFVRITGPHRVGANASGAMGPPPAR